MGVIKGDSPNPQVIASASAPPKVVSASAGLPQQIIAAGSLRGGVGFTGAQGPQGSQGGIGPVGPQGEQGVPGFTAYQHALSLGFEGTEAEWLVSMTGPEGPQGPKGNQGNGLHINGAMDSPASLPGSGNSEVGDVFLINGDIWAYDGTQWANAGPIQGPQGITGTTGAKGATGDSAYQQALLLGFIGDEAAWIASLKGDQGVQGDQGDQGEIGPQGIQGTQGIQGEQGVQGIQGVQGDTGPQGLKGDGGYAYALTQGFVGTEADWVLTLKGEKGDTGNTGLKGDTGDTGPQGVQGVQGIQGIQGLTGRLEAASIVAAVTMSAGAFVNIYDAGGVAKVRKADATLLYRADGFLLDAVSNGTTANVYPLSLVNTALTGLVSGAPYYLSVDGGVSTTPVFSAGHLYQRVGIALTNTTLNTVNDLAVELV